MAYNRKPKVWDRQPKESWQAHEAFLLYLNMGDTRSQAKVAVKLGKSTTLMNRWSSEWDWVERVRAYDNFMFEEDTKRAKNEIKARYERIGKISDTLMATAIEALKNVNPKKLSPQDTLAFMRIAATFADKHKVTALPRDFEDMDEGMLGGLLSALLSEDYVDD